jgi:hypothetical protein
MCKEAEPYMICACSASKTDVCFQLRTTKAAGVELSFLCSHFRHGEMATKGMEQGLPEYLIWVWWGHITYFREWHGEVFSKIQLS